MHHRANLIKWLTLVWRPSEQILQVLYEFLVFTKLFDYLLCTEPRREPAQLMAVPKIRRKKSSCIQGRLALAFSKQDIIESKCVTEWSIPLGGCITELRQQQDSVRNWQSVSMIVYNVGLAARLLISKWRWRKQEFQSLTKLLRYHEPIMSKRSVNCLFVFFRDSS